MNKIKHDMVLVSKVRCRKAAECESCIPGASAGTPAKEMGEAIKALKASLSNGP